MSFLLEIASCSCLTLVVCILSFNYFIFLSCCSPCDFDIYYSGGRGRRVYRTDFRTGESVLVCTTNAEVLDMALVGKLFLKRGDGLLAINCGRFRVACRRQDNGGLPISRGILLVMVHHEFLNFTAGMHVADRISRGREQSGSSMSMWLSSTKPDITFWGGYAGGGTTLRSGGLLGDYNSNSSIAPETGSYFMTLGKGGVGLESGNGKSLLERPVAVIRGQPGIVRHVVLNNRRVLVEYKAFHDLFPSGGISKRV